MAVGGASRGAARGKINRRDWSGEVGPDWRSCTKAIKRGGKKKGWKGRKSSRLNC